jgi:hypothetical protein
MSDALLTSVRGHFQRDRLDLYCGAGAVLFWIITVVADDYSRMSGYGLVSVLGWPYFAGLLLVVLGFGVELCRPILRHRHLLLLIVILIVYIYGTACAIEPVSALTDSWIHAGFIQYILLHGHPLNGYDARFSWPGAFSMAAILTRFVGEPNALSFLRWFPLLIELAYLAPLLVIGRFSGVGRRAAWLGIAFYVTSNWIYQDYFSPQALAFFFFLVVIATTLACWQPMKIALNSTQPHWILDRLRRTRHAFSRDRLAGRHATSSWTSNQTLALVALFTLIFTAGVMSHQLTPPAIILALAALLVTRRLGRPELVVLIVVLTFGWLSLGASNYWVGHLSDIFGSLGQFGSKLSSNVTSRVTGQPTHLIVVELRILLTAAVFFVAGIGTLRRSADSRTLEALVMAPFVLFAAQSYGGEGLIRVVLFGLPFTSLLAASAFLPRANAEIPPIVPMPSGRLARLVTTAVPVAIVVAVLACALVTTVVRGGNDAYESFSTGELAAVNYVYDHVHKGQIIGSVNYYIPIGQKDVGSVSQYFAPDEPENRLKRISGHLLDAAPAYIILSKSQEAYGEEVVGDSPGWEAAVQRSLTHHGYFVVARWSTATVLKKGKSPTTIHAFSTALRGGSLAQPTS